MKLQGGNLIEELLNSIGNYKVTAAIYRDANKKILKDHLLSQLKEAAPTPDIKKALKLVSLKNSKTGAMVAIDKKAAPKAYIAHFIEFGAGIEKPRETRKTKENRGTLDAQPFYRPTYESQKSEILKAIQNEYGDYINDQIKRKIKQTERKIDKLT